MRAIIIERWSIPRFGLRAVLGQAGHQVVRTTALAEEGIDVVRDRPDIDLVVLGAAEGAEQVKVVADLVADAPTLRVLVLVDRPDRDEVDDLLTAGASGLVGRLADEADLLDALRRIDRGERVLSSEVIEAMVRVPEGIRLPSSLPVTLGEGLTARELEVLACLGRGASNREIATRLFIGQSTVKTHLGAIYAKLGVTSRHQAVARAFETGLLDRRQAVRIEEAQLFEEPSSGWAGSRWGGGPRGGVTHGPG